MNNMQTTVSKKHICRTHHRVGVTLAEMLVAVSITVLMLLATGIVFKASSEATGKATALIEISRQARALTNLLDQDLSNLNPDMPLCLLFQRSGTERQDRITFFATGEFENSIDPTISSRLARVYYGQMLNTPDVPDRTNNPVYSYPRSVLNRRFKMIVGDPFFLDPNPVLVNASLNSSPIVQEFPYKASFLYDTGQYYSAEHASADYWKNEPYVNYANTSLGYLVDDPCCPSSIIRRSDYKQYGFNTELQPVYLLPDVTDFKIQLWFDGTGTFWDHRWFPDEYDYDYMVRDLATITYTPGAAPPPNYYFGLFWNIHSDINSPYNMVYYNPPYTFIPNKVRGSVYVPWFSEQAIAYYLSLGLGANTAGGKIWPKAMRVSFRLYDRNRRHFPEGRMFEYIVKLPPRD